MSVSKRGSSDVVLKLPAAVRIKLVKQFGRKFRQKAREAKMWRELLQVDILSINGKVVWKENQHSSRVYVRNEKKRK